MNKQTYNDRLKNYMLIISFGLKNYIFSNDKNALEN